MFASTARIIAVSFFAVVAAQRGSRCSTPNQEEGVCEPVEECEPIRTAIATLESTAINFAKESGCGFDNNVQMVCCGTVGNYTEVHRILEQQGAPFPDETAPRRTYATATPKVKTSSAMADKLPDKSICGIQGEETRIIGGETTEIGEFPWMALLRYTNLNGSDAGFQCGGTLINDRYVLTAAHCLRGTVEKEFKIASIRLGEWNITSLEDCYTEGECADSPRDVDIEEEIVHPYFTSTTGNNDIALLRMATRVEFTDFVRPICVPPSNISVVAPGTLLTVAGWGLTKQGMQSTVKLKVNVPVVSNADCTQKIRRSQTMISNNQLCAGGEKEKDACKGDSGGPLMGIIRTGPLKGQWYQEGIVSKGIGCGVGFPGIYTRVARYTDWILNNLRQ